MSSAIPYWWAAQRIAKRLWPKYFGNSRRLTAGARAMQLLYVAVECGLITKRERHNGYRYQMASGERPTEALGDELITAIDAVKRLQPYPAELNFVTGVDNTNPCREVPLTSFDLSSLGRSKP